jgi:hypothetical protein
LSDSSDEEENDKQTDTRTTAFLDSTFKMYNEISQKGSKESAEDSQRVIEQIVDVKHLRCLVCIEKVNLHYTTEDLSL